MTLSSIETVTTRPRRTIHRPEEKKIGLSKKELSLAYNNDIDEHIISACQHQTQAGRTFDDSNALWQRVNFHVEATKSRP